MKIAPVMAAMRPLECPLVPFLVHTGQHYDSAMKHCFFEQLSIPEPDIDLEVGSASHAVQTADIMKRFEPVLDREKPAAVLVVGDVNSTIACALVAVKKGCPVVHVEAGLRSYDRTMPEEINRVLTDAISDVLFTTERSAQHNLMREGIDETRVHFVGNVMIDTLHQNLTKAVPAAQTLRSYPARRESGTGILDYGILTLHRPSNVDDLPTLKRLLTVVRECSEMLPVVFPVHPRTQGRIHEAGLDTLLDGPRIIKLTPLGYLEMLGLMKDARLVMTDSGGMQEETTALGVPCLTLRENTERPITVEQGTNTIVGTDPDTIRQVFSDIMVGGGKAGRIPEYWDGQAAQRIVNVLVDCI